MKNTVTRFLKTRKISHNKKYPRTPLDEILEYLRFTKVVPYIPKGATLLDIGTGDGAFLHYLNGHVRDAVGIDPYLTHRERNGNYQLIPGNFPYDYDENTTFDVITLLATIEHIPMDEHLCVVKGCWKYLNPGGQVILTVPHPHVDRLLDVLKKLRILEGFSMHEHYGFNPECLLHVFKGWRLLKKDRWELGCNYLFIFEKPETVTPDEMEGTTTPLG